MLIRQKPVDDLLRNLLLLPLMAVLVATYRAGPSENPIWVFARMEPSKGLFLGEMSICVTQGFLRLVVVQSIPTQFLMGSDAIRKRGILDLFLGRGEGLTLLQGGQSCVLRRPLLLACFRGKRVVVKRYLFPGQLIPAQLLLVLAVGPHIVEVPLIPDVTELLKHLGCPAIGRLPCPDFFDTLTGTSFAVAASHRADYPRNGKPSIGREFNLAEGPCLYRTADLAETRANYLFHRYSLPFLASAMISFMLLSSRKTISIFLLSSKPYNSFRTASGVMSRQLW